ncbi:MAG: hypothetical protein WCH98_21070, partial [Verrucomicrobiota bacterium]
MTWIAGFLTDSRVFPAIQTSKSRAYYPNNQKIVAFLRADYKGASLVAGWGFSLAFLSASSA